MKNEITSKEYWQQSGVLNAKEHPVPISIQKIFKKTLKINNDENRSALEIGCAPGDFLAYICKEFKYKPEGIDYVDGSAQITKNKLKENGLNESNIYEDDFFLWESEKKYDLVCSFGFIEHFNDVQPVINKHISLLKKEGVLIIEIPNFSNGQYIFHKLLDKENLNRHNLESMRLAFFKKLAVKHNLKIKYLGYAGGLFDFWWENNSPTLLQKIAFLFIKPIAFIGRKIPFNNKFFSPFIVFIAENNS